MIHIHARKKILKVRIIQTNLVVTSDSFYLQNINYFRISESGRTERERLRNSTNLANASLLWECSLRDKNDPEISYVVRQLADWIKIGLGNAAI